MRAVANEDVVDDEGIERNVDDFETRLVVPCLETGTLNRCTARLMQAGFTSRLAVIKAVTDTDANFANAHETYEWLKSIDVLTLSQDQSWPTAESHRLWLAFVDQQVPPDDSVWSVQYGVFPVTWHVREAPPVGDIVDSGLQTTANATSCRLLSRN